VTILLRECRATVARVVMLLARRVHRAARAYERRARHDLHRAAQRRFWRDE